MTSYYEKNKERILTYNRKWRKENPEKRKKQRTLHRLKYIEREREKQAKWKLENPEKVKEQRIRERTKKNPNWKPRIKLSEEEKIKRLEKKRIIKEGYIYVIKSGKYHKIGRTLNFKHRIKKYITENPNKVKIILCKKVNDYIGVENRLHSELKNKNYNREWFKLENEDINFINNFLLSS